MRSTVSKRCTERSTIHPDSSSSFLQAAILHIIFCLRTFNWSCQGLNLGPSTWQGCALHHSATSPPRHRKTLFHLCHSPAPHSGLASGQRWGLGRKGCLRNLSPQSFIAFWGGFTWPMYPKAGCETFSCPNSLPHSHTHNSLIPLLPPLCPSKGSGGKCPIYNGSKVVSKARVKTETTLTALSSTTSHIGDHFIKQSEPQL